MVDITLTALVGWAQLELQWENNCLLMEAIKGTKLFALEDLERINQCWQHLKVLTLANITTGMGLR